MLGRKSRRGARCYLVKAVMAQDVNWKDKKMAKSVKKSKYPKGRFQDIRKKYGAVASWAVWAPMIDKPKSGISDLSIFNEDHPDDILRTIHTDFLLIALNFSRTPEKAKWANFHSSNPYATDFNLRDAVEDTPLWGSYMTDLIKNLVEVKGSKVIDRIRAEPEILTRNIKSLRKEIDYVSAGKPTLVAVGKKSYDLITHKKNGLADEFKIIKIPHYANNFKKGEYRKSVLEALSSFQSA